MAAQQVIVIGQYVKWLQHSNFIYADVMPWENFQPYWPLYGELTGHQGIPRKISICSSVLFAVASLALVKYMGQWHEWPSSSRIFLENMNKVNLYLNWIFRLIYLRFHAMKYFATRDHFHLHRSPKIKTWISNYINILYGRSLLFHSLTSMAVELNVSIS